MTTQPDFTVTNLAVGTKPAPDGKGGMTTVKTLSYMVGDHGPFYHEYQPGVGTAAQMKSDIGAQVAELRDLHTVTG